MDSYYIVAPPELTAKTTADKADCEHLSRLFENCAKLFLAGARETQIEQQQAEDDPAMTTAFEEKYKAELQVCSQAVEINWREEVPECFD